jgi:2-keto-3-deoxy-L-rhamnonate aldolase RhmA
MRGRIALGLVVLAALGVSVTVTGQQKTHLNPMVDLLIAKKAIFGVGMPTAGRGGGGGNRGGGGGGQTTGTAVSTTPTPTPATPPPAPKTPADLAKDALAHPESDYFFTASMERNAETGSTNLIALQDALAELGNVSKGSSPRLLMPINSKGPNITSSDKTIDPATTYIANISRQLNAGVSSIAFVEVDNAEDLRQGIAAMRFKSKGGTRPDDVGNAPKYWGLSEAEYRRRADVFPLNPEGELVVWAIVETKEGLANLREIAQVPGLSVLVPGAGTLGGVFTTTNPDGSRGPRDNVAWEAAIQQVLATCKEFKLPCGYPVSEADIETRYQQGFNVGILQQFNDAAFRAVAKGRQISGRDK